MFTESLSDPTAGQRAQRVRLWPEVPPPVLDPTDPRYGSVPLRREPREAEEPPAEPRRLAADD